MTKQEFLDILRDYLRGYFTLAEISDILRDYEEYFLNGELEGKSEKQVIESLGSPKSIAEDLIREIKGDVPLNDEGTIYNDMRSLGSSFIELLKKAGKKVSGFLSSSDIINGKIPTWVVKLLLVILTLCILPFVLSVVGGMIISIVGLILGTCTSLVGLVSSFVFIGTDGAIGWFIFFIALVGIGVMIALWTMFIAIYKLLKLGYIRYSSWVKTRCMYIKVKNKKDNIMASKEGHE
ncbi:MAG: DUF1700 domain-containing protein [Clostridium sp.]|uniref:DUF1700 domain-containing protein n=1 Tax=Clostridium sp. TaxID=1506 RepID=UPI002FC7850B